MKKTKSLLSFAMALVMLASCAVFSVSAEKAAPEYEIDFVYDVNEATATALISIKGGEYCVGRFGFNYNTDVLKLVKADGTDFDASTDFIKDAVVGQSVDGVYTVVVTEETNTVADLVDSANGNVLFAWYTVDDKSIDATTEAKALVSVKFKLTEEYTAKANPAVALSNVEKTITPVGSDVLNENIKGWDDVVYLVSDSEKDKLVSNKTNVDVSDTYITTDISGVNATATVTNKTQLFVTVSWDSEALEAEGNIAKYIVTVTNKSGSAVINGDGIPASSEIDAIADNRDTNGNYKVVFDSTDGLSVGKNYVFTVTPVTVNGELGIPTSASADTSNVQGPVQGGGYPTGGGSGGGASSPIANTIKITFDAAGGVIPEGQQYIFDVAVGGYISTTPEVIAPAGKVFAGWSVDGSTLVSVPVYKITKAVVFKAIYADAEEEIHRTFIVGYPDGEVKAVLSLTRAEASAIIARSSEDFDASKTYTANFSDVAAGSWYYNYIGYVYEKGIVTGYQDGTFAPDSKITRAEFATIMQRYLGLAGNENTVFNDVAGHWAVAAIGACKDAGLINGYENGEFRPDRQITRAEAVTILNRAAGRAPSATAIDTYINEKGIPFSDLSKAEWYFYEIMEAAFPHLVIYFH